MISGASTDLLALTPIVQRHRLHYKKNGVGLMSHGIIQDIQSALKIFAHPCNYPVGKF